MIAVTGATGLLGSMLVKQLSSEGIPFFGIRRKSSGNDLINGLKMEWKESDILDSNALLEALEGATTVIHTAALVSFKAGDGESLHRINVDGTRNVVNACLALGISRLIHVSSVAALGRQKNIEIIDEDSKWVDNKLNSAYAESKYLAELEVFRGQEEGLQIDIINPSIILSQGNWKKSSAQIYRYVWQNQPFYTDGSINYVDARDVVKTITTLLQSKPTGERYIVNAGNIQLKELLSLIANQFNKRPPWIRVPGGLISLAAGVEYLRSIIAGTEPMVTAQSARSAQEKFFYDNRKITQNLGIDFRPLSETIEWTCKYYLQNSTTNN